MAAPVSACQLEAELVHREQENQQQLLVIDCRPFLVYNLSHITHAHNVHCPPIVKRRSGGSLPLENIIRCSTTRTKLQTGQYTTVVIYDENTESLDQLTADSNMTLVLKSLTEDTELKGVFFLEGKLFYIFWLHFILFLSVYCLYLWLWHCWWHWQCHLPVQRLAKTHETFGSSSGTWKLQKNQVSESRIDKHS